MMHCVRRHLNNESGVAALIVVVLAIVIIGTIGLSFVADQQQKHQGAAAAVTSTRALNVADAGMRYAEKCLGIFSLDPDCPCNSGPPNNCSLFDQLSTGSPWSAISFGNGSFVIDFTNESQCKVDVISTGTVASAVREVRKSIGNELLSTIAVSNPQGIASAGSPAMGFAPASVAEFSATGNSVTHTLSSYLVPVSATDPILIVVAGAGHKTDGLAVPTAATFNGNAMTLASSTFTTGAAGNNFDVGTGLFWKSVAAGEMGDIVITFAGAVKAATIQAVTMTNASPSGPAVIATPATADPGSSINLPITTVNDGATVMTGVHSSPKNLITASGGPGHALVPGSTSLPDSNSEGAMGNIPGVSPAGLRTPTFSDASSTHMAMVGASFPSVGGASTSLPYTVDGALTSNDLQLVVFAGAEAPNGAGLDANNWMATFNSVTVSPIPAARVNQTAGGVDISLAMFRFPVTAGDSDAISINFNGVTTSNRAIQAMTLTEVRNADPVIAVNNVYSPTFTKSITTAVKTDLIVSGGFMDVSGTMSYLPNSTTHVPDGTLQNTGSSVLAMGHRTTTTPGLVSGTGWDLSTASPSQAGMILASFSPIELCP